MDGSIDRKVRVWISRAYVMDAVRWKTPIVVDLLWIR
jgi:hypothetical protein